MGDTIRKVVLISGNSLFREGLARVVDDLEGFELIGMAATIEEAADMMRLESPDVILFARDPCSGAQDQLGAGLLKDSNAQVVELSVSSSDMTVYSRKRIPHATVADLAAALRYVE